MLEGVKEFFLFIIAACPLGNRRRIGPLASQTAWSLEFESPFCAFDERFPLLPNVAMRGLKLGYYPSADNAVLHARWQVVTELQSPDRSECFRLPRCPNIHESIVNTLCSFLWKWQFLILVLKNGLVCRFQWGETAEETIVSAFAFPLFVHIVMKKGLRFLHPSPWFHSGAPGAIRTHGL